MAEDMNCSLMGPRRCGAIPNALRGKSHATGQIASQRCGIKLSLRRTPRLVPEAALAHSPEIATPFSGFRQSFLDKCSFFPALATPGKRSRIPPDSHWPRWTVGFHHSRIQGRRCCRTPPKRFPSSDPIANATQDRQRRNAGRLRRIKIQMPAV